jgi:hypothetical protein
LTTDPNKTSADMVLGSAAHKLILEGRHEFDLCYAVGAPVNERTGKEYGRDTQAFARWVEQQRADKGSAVNAPVFFRKYNFGQRMKSIS